MQITEEQLNAVKAIFPEHAVSVDVQSTPHGLRIYVWEWKEGE